LCASFANPAKPISYAPPPMPPPKPSPLRAAPFVLLAALCLTPFASPPIALAAGVLLAFLNLSAFESFARRSSRILIQVCVVLLGFRMNLAQLADAGIRGVLFAAGTIAATFAVGHVLGRWLNTEPKLTTLLSSGTAICGGSAISATGSVIGATPTQMSVAIGTVFLLNAAALFLFPWLGHLMHMTDPQFGTWAAVAIHDISSVVGASTYFAQHYSDAPTGTSTALQVATAVKLSRTLWIVPVSLAAAWLLRRQQSRAPLGAMAVPGAMAAPRGYASVPSSTDPAPVPPEEEPTESETEVQLTSAPRKRPPLIPWFIAAFIIASAARTAFPSIETAGPTLSLIAKTGMTLALFLIGTGLSRKAIAHVGWRPLLQGVVLWVFISVTSFLVIRATIA